ncbi:glutamate mutase L [Micromonospora sp. NPDC048871]|uniref:glutamate mutase L n=1 Tax=unclassified Micromonospora TaxID=2617518 RepID=UPI002E131BF0|nr:glutamate mutase L [Micromonospora sp. NBC_01739]
MRVAVCADVGSTFTKVSVVDLDGGGLVASAAARTSVDTDVWHGLEVAVGAALAGRWSPQVPWLVCSSAGGGLRLAVVGYEPLVTAQAGRRVGLSAGADVVHVAAGRLGRAELTALRAARPDVVLLVGGTDGGDAETLTHNATRLARARFRVPVVLAGNVAVRDGLQEVLAQAGVPVTVADNVLPRIGVLAPASAREAIRQVFLRHVIGGKRLSRGRRFARLVRAATPDAVLTGVEALAELAGGDLVVVDVGGATTDVYSVLTPDERASGPGREVAGSLWRARTVEGDLGMRWSAPQVVRAAVEERLLGEPEGAELVGEAARRAADPGFLPADASGRAVDARIAALAATVALRRHARGVGTGERSGRDLRDVRLVVGSGGVLRHAPREVAEGVLGAVLTDHAGGWALPRAARPVVDVDYVLAAAGLLVGEYPVAARGLLRPLLGRSAGGDTPGCGGDSAVAG